MPSNTFVPSLFVGYYPYEGALQQVIISHHKCKSCGAGVDYYYNIIRLLYYLRMYHIYHYKGIIDHSPYIVDSLISLTR